VLALIIIIIHGVGVITKLHFAIFVALKESMTLNLAQSSIKVIHFGGNRKPVYIRLSLIVAFVLSSTVSEILRLYTPEPTDGRTDNLSCQYRALLGFAR